MLISSRILAVSVGALLFGCAVEQDENQEIIDNLVEAGFPADDITVVEGLVYVGRDAEVSLEASREMLAPLDVTEEQYRTTNLVGSNIGTICIDPSSAFTGDFSTGIDLAIENFNQLGLSYTLVRGSGCDATIRAVLKRNLVGGSAGFPKSGKPYRTINIGDGLAPFGLDVIEHVITHEIGHTVGLRHSDFFDRSISCGGSGGNEGDAGIGAIHIPGTPTGATEGGSVMNSCFRDSENGEWTSSDRTALQTLY